MSEIKSAPSAPTSGSSAEPGGVTLSRDLADFLVELSIALHKHAIYPAGHPLLDGAVDALMRRLDALLAVRSVLSIGIARKQLVIEGVATDPAHPLLHELAQKLHHQQLGALKFLQGADRAELAQALATLGTDASRMPAPLGTQTEALAERWPHVRLFPLSYDRLELLDEDPEVEAADRAGIGRAAQLWVGLARAALAAEIGDHEGALEPGLVAKAIDEHQREQAYDQVIVGYLLQIANELKTAEESGAESAALQRRISKLVGELKPETLTRLLEMGGDDRQRRRFLLDATQGMTVDAVVDLVRAAADAEKQTVSHSLVRMLSKLAQHAEKDQGVRRLEADRSLREAVNRLVSEWTLDDPNPEGYRAALEAMARGAAASAPASTIELECEPERLIEMGLELGVAGAQLRRAVDRMAASGRLAALLDLLDAAPSPDDGVVAGIWSYIVERDTLRELLAAERMDHALVDRVVRRAGVSSLSTLLDAVESSEDAKTRERLYDRIVAFGAAAGPYIAPRLAAARPLLQRELLAIVGRLPELPAELDAGAYLHHADAAVRREAVKLLLRNPLTRDATLLAALADVDARTVYVALQAAQERCPRAGVELLRGRVDRGELDAGLRAHAIKVIAALHTPETLQWLLRHITTTSAWLHRTRLLPSSPETLAALAAVASAWRDDPAVAPVLALARRKGVSV